MFNGLVLLTNREYVLDAIFSIFEGKLFDPDFEIREGIGCEVGKLESWISDDGASRHTTSSHDSMKNCCECSRIVRTAGGDVLPIESVGDSLLRFLSDSGAFDVQHLSVAFVPQLSHNVLSLQQLTATNHTYFGTKNDVELRFKSSQTLQAGSSAEQMYCAGTVWPEMTIKLFRATIALGVKPPNFNMNVNINEFHCSFGHVPEGLLRETAKQPNVNLIGTLWECQGCSISKRRVELISTKFETQAGVEREDKEP